MRLFGLLLKTVAVTRQTISFVDSTTVCILHSRVFCTQQSHSDDYPEPVIPVHFSTTSITGNETDLPRLRPSTTCKPDAVQRIAGRDQLGYFPTRSNGNYNVTQHLTNLLYGTGIHDEATCYEVFR
jgi:hypothetical protein